MIDWVEFIARYPLELVFIADNFNTREEVYCAPLEPPRFHVNRGPREITAVNLLEIDFKLPANTMRLEVLVVANINGERVVFRSLTPRSISSIGADVMHSPPGALTVKM